MNFILSGPRRGLKLDRDYGVGYGEVMVDVDKCLVRPWDESQLGSGPGRTELGGQ